MSLFDLPEKTFELIEKYNIKPLDPEKQTFVLIFSRLNFSGEQDHIIGWMKDMVKEIIAKQYNIVFLGVDTNPERLVEMGFSNVYGITNKKFEELKAKSFKREKEMDEDHTAWEHNNSLIIQHLTQELPNINPEYVMWLDERFAFLPLKDYIKASSVLPGMNSGNEFHDYVGTDPNVLQRINEACGEISNKYDYHVNILTFNYWMKNLIYNLGAYYIQRSDKFIRSYYFVVDPGSYYKVFEKFGKEHWNYALVEDKRGTRDFRQFPIAELQHAYFEKNHLMNTSKNKKFIFYGTLFLSKGTRKEVWTRYLKDLRMEGADIYAPPRVDGIIPNRAKEKKSLTKFEEKITTEKEVGDLWAQVSSHPHYRGYLDTQELNRTLSQYQYGFIPKNIAFNDVMNWRPVLYLSLNVFPILDYRYDPEYLGVPQKFQEKICAKDSADIERIVDYYEAHPEEREELMAEMKAHYRIDTFRNEWKEDVKNCLGIGELITT